MARVSPERREEILAAIRVHLTSVGPHGFDALHAKFPAADREHLVRTLHRLAAGRFASAAPPSGSCV